MHQKRNHFGDILLIIGVFLLAVYFLPVIPTKYGKNGETLAKIEFIPGYQWLSTH